MFWIKNKKNKYTPAYPSFAIYMGVYITRTCCILFVLLKFACYNAACELVPFRIEAPAHINENKNAIL